MEVSYTIDIDVVLTDDLPHRSDARSSQDSDTVAVESCNGVACHCAPTPCLDDIAGGCILCQIKASLKVLAIAVTVLFESLLVDLKDLRPDGRPRAGWGASDGSSTDTTLNPASRAPAMNRSIPARTLPDMGAVDHCSTTPMVVCPISTFGIASTGTDHPSAASYPTTAL